MLRSYDLVSRELKVVGKGEEIAYHDKRGKLLSVGFFKQIENVRPFDVAKPSDLPRQPVVFIY